MGEGKLKPGWTRVAFGEFAENVNERVDDPASSGVDVYVGLEHLDPESLKIRRWGSPSDVESTKLRFRPGDIIFGKRRVYQRKLGVAEVDGICSAHALVLRDRPELPGFLAFFMQSDLFMERALSISVGSLSPTINWRTLAKQEFILPPIKEQERVVELLLAVEEVRESLSDTVDGLRILISSFIENAIKRAIVKPEPLESVLADVRYGSSKPSNSESRGIPILRIPNVLRGSLDLGDLVHSEVTDEEYAKLKLEAGDILVVRTNGNPLYVGRCVEIPELSQGTIFASYLIRLRLYSNRAIPQYVAAFLNSPSIRASLRKSVRSSAGNYNINTKGLRSQMLPIPPINEQQMLVKKLVRWERSLKYAEDRLILLEQTKRGILNSI